MVERASILELSRQEIIDRIEREAQRRLGMSARELLLAYMAGRLQDPGAVADLIALANLLREDDPLLGAA